MTEEKLLLGIYEPEAGDDVAYYYIDEHNLCVVYTDNKGIGDSIGRTMTAYMVYNDDKLVQAIANLWQYREEFNNKLVGIRHPDILTKDVEGKYVTGFWENRMSRDHYIYTLIALKLWEMRNGQQHPKLKEIVNATPFGIRRMARWTLSLILWSKSLAGNKWALWFYLIFEWLQTNIIYRPIRWLGYKLTGWKEEVDQEDWGWTSDIDPSKQSEEWRKNHLLQAQPKWKQKISKIVFPSYAILFAAHQLHVLPDTFPKLKKGVQKSLLKMVEKTNYVQKMLLGEKDIPKDKVESFKTMSGGRWSGHLNGRNDRNMKVFPEGRFTANLLDVDTVRFLFNETQTN